MSQERSGWVLKQQEITDNPGIQTLNLFVQGPVHYWCIPTTILADTPYKSCLFCLLLSSTASLTIQPFHFDQFPSSHEDRVATHFNQITLNCTFCQLGADVMHGRLSLFLAVISLFLATATASPQIRCTNDEPCISFEENPPWGCKDGYETSLIDVPHHTLVTHCERNCNDAEQKRCDAKLCDSNRRACEEHHSTRIGFCKRALELCKSPIKTEEGICTINDMDNPVKYDTSTGECSIDSSVDLTGSGPGNQKVTFNIASTEAARSLRFTCDHLSDKGRSLYLHKVFLTRGLTCLPSGTNCLTSKKSVMDSITGVAKQACDKGEHARGHKTVFQVE